MIKFISYYAIIFIIAACLGFFMSKLGAPLWLIAVSGFMIGFMSSITKNFLDSRKLKGK